MLGLTEFINLEEGARLTFKAQNGESNLFCLRLLTQLACHSARDIALTHFDAVWGCLIAL
jgi:hypothetical protein